eukprot:g18549.t1
MQWKAGLGTDANDPGLHKLRSPTSRCASWTIPAHGLNALLNHGTLNFYRYVLSQCGYRSIFKSQNKLQLDRTHNPIHSDISSIYSGGKMFDLIHNDRQMMKIKKLNEDAYGLQTQS